jgi:pimeloyl-ACP methyl ester carboxylesterase
MPRVETGIGELYYTVKRRPKDGPVLVLVHGAGGSRLHWPPQLRRMIGATVYTLDLPGHARSGGDGCETIDCYVEAVVAFLDGVAVDQAVIGGHSMGGAIAQTLALEADERVSALVLVGTGARLRVATAILEGIKDDFEKAIDLVTRYAWSPDTDPSLSELGRQGLRETRPDVLLGDFAACDRFDIMDRLGEIKVPALVIGGSVDKLTPVKYARYLAEHIPDARLVTVEGAGHMVMLEQPEQVADAVREFVMASHSTHPETGSLSDRQRAR